MVKRKRLFDRFQEDYTAIVVPCDNKDGFRIEYAYYSPWYVWDEPEDALKRRKKTLLGEGVAVTAVFLLTAAYPSVLNSLALVAFPALFSLCMLVFLLFALAQFYRAKYRTTRFTFQYVHKRIRIFSILTGLFSFGAALGAVYYAVGYGFSLEMLSTFAGYGLNAALCLHIYKQYASLPYHTEKNDILEHVERASLD